MSRKMIPTVKAEWLTALRSGEFPQGTGYLCRDGKFCCLGVLTELGERAEVVERIDPPEHLDQTAVTYLSIESSGFGSPEQSVTPRPVVNWAGIGQAIPTVPVDALTPEQMQRVDPSGYYKDNHTEIEVTVLNDQGLTFLEIADLIEAHL